eukprot:86352_1
MKIHQNAFLFVSFLIIFSTGTHSFTVSTLRVLAVDSGRARAKIAQSVKRCIDTRPRPHPRIHPRIQTSGSNLTLLPTTSSKNSNLRTYTGTHSGISLTATSERTMESDIARIRRERWLQSQSKSKSQSKKSETSTRDNDEIEIVSRGIGNDKNGDDFPMRVSRKKATVTAKHRSSSSKSGLDLRGAIDLTLSDTDDENSKDDTSDGVTLVKSTGSNTNQTSSSDTNRRLKGKSTQKIRKRKLSPKSSSSASSASASALSSARTENQSRANKDTSRSDLSFSILSYNIWFGDPHPTERMERISEIISELQCRPIFLGLQEVTPALLRDLSPLLQSMGYRIICQEDVTYGCALGILTSPSEEASNSVTLLQSGFQPYRESRMARGLLWLHAAIGDYEIFFSTTHLESFIRGNDGSRERVLQLKEANEFIRQFVSGTNRSIDLAMITGDLNWDDERKRSKGTEPNMLDTINENENVAGRYSSWHDAWLETRRGKADDHDGYTFDSKLNPMLKGNLRRRFDRCLYITHDGKTVPSINSREAGLIGKDAITGLSWRKEVQQWRYGQPSGETSIDVRPLCPSDHFGLNVAFSNGDDH